MKSVLSPCVEIARKRRYANLNAFVVQLFRQLGKLEAAPAHPLQCRIQGKDGFPDRQRTASIKADSGGFEAGKFRPDGFDMIRGNAHGCSPPVSLTVSGQAGRLPTGFTQVKHSGLYLRPGRRFLGRHLTAFVSCPVCPARQSLRIAFPPPAAAVPLSAVPEGRPSGVAGFPAPGQIPGRFPAPVPCVPVGVPYPPFPDRGPCRELQAVPAAFSEQPLRVAAHSSGVR